MATPFRLKRSAVANKRPGLTDLQLGELALNTYDGRLFAERDTGGVGIGTTIALLTPFTENYGGGSIYYNDGSVGIGTTNPTGKFEVFGGRIVGAATSNVIPFLYSNYSDLPSASTYHGAFAHVHSVGKGFFAHAGNWIEIVSKETNGTVGSGTERYNIGPTDLTTLDVSGISTFAEQVSVGSSINVTGVVTASSFVGPLTGTATGLTGTPNIEVGIVTASSFVGTGVSVVGVVTATSYVGSGVALSGIVTSLVAGSNITLSGSTGRVTISSSGGGGTGGKFVSNNTGIHTLSNVGIGTTNASDDLTVRGDIAFTGRLKVTDLGLAGSNGQYLKSVGSGVTWASFPDARTSQTFTATDGQTTFTFTYNVNFIDVYVNGVKLAASEFTATNGTSVVLDEACFAGDIVEVISFNTTATGGGGSGGITDVVQDATPQLGGNLDLNNKSITGTGNVSISGIVTATSFVGGLTGNSSSATQLQTSRNIGGVAFNGTSNINLPGVNQTGTQSINTSGIVTASSLVGTGVSVVGVVTATSFVGSGANLTGVLTPTGNGIGLSGIVTSIIAGTNVTISGATGAVTINASGGGGGSIAGISTTGTSHFANLQLIGITTGLNVSGVSTFAGNILANGNIVGDNSTNISGISSVTATTFYGSAAGLTNVPSAQLTGALPALDGSALTGIAVTASSNVQVTWDVTANGSSAYRFAGPGNDASDDNPDLYLVRGQRYRFTNNSGGSHPFQIRSSAGGSAYSTGVTNNGASSGNIDFNVQHDAPARLYYQCTSHSGMVGNIYITGGANWQTTNVNTSTAEEIFTLNNVGIGTDNPTDTGGYGQVLDITGGSSGAAIYLRSANGDTGQIALGSSDLTIRTRQADPIIFNTNNSERLRITSAGIVKIGSNTLATPNGNADNFVIDTGDVDSGLSILSATTGRIYFGDAADAAAGSIRYVHTDNSLRFEASAGEKLRITSDGNLQAIGASDVRLTLGSGGTAGTNDSVHMRADSNDLKFMCANGGTTIFERNGTESLRITSGGDVVIGNSSAEDSAHFQHYQSGARHQSFQSNNGDLAIVTDNNSNPAVYIKGTGTADLVKVFDNTTQVFTIKDGGNVEVNGNIVMGNGNGVDFSADPDASGRESELLDDYEHGTFTPIIKVESSGSNAAIDNVSGTYVKVGKLVYAGFHVELNGLPSGRSSSAAIEFYGMPFTSLAEGSSGLEEHIGSVRCHPVDNGTSLGACSEFIFRLFDNNTSGRIEVRKSDGNLANASLYMRDNMQITAAITYRTAS